MENEKISLTFTQLNKFGWIPTFGSSVCVGIDLRSAYSYRIEPLGWTKVETEIGIKQFPPGCYGRKAPRSGLAVSGISVGGGVIDPDYTNSIGTVLYNHHPSIAFLINPGDRVEQLILEECLFPLSVVLDCEESSVLRELKRNPSLEEKGGKGFGSSGIK
ncbi:unnamed protein product [Bemisia tabaci]|uniref:Deoxyuridine 5'-triphosphate nucleotidohydrolase n=1 Tax=Bemisia tabaci TaxID=7038 RepID=A0A9P0EXI3_BEMTA|nr:unnamed protein product [Bemisia tabaci]